MEDTQMKQSYMCQYESQIWCQNPNDQVRLQKTMMGLQFCVTIKYKTVIDRTKGKKELFTTGNRFWIVRFTKCIICKIWRVYIFISKAVWTLTGYTVIMVWLDEWYGPYILSDVHNSVLHLILWSQKINGSRQRTSLHNCRHSQPARF